MIYFIPINIFLYHHQQNQSIKSIFKDLNHINYDPNLILIDKF